MRAGWIPAGSTRILLLGSCILLLQQVGIPYRFTLAGVPSGEASLIHLQTGLLMAIAMLERDRLVVAGCFAVDFLGWAVRGWLLGYAPTDFAGGALMSAVLFGWVLACARWLGWPRPEARQEVSPRDVTRFAIAGLLVFPLGHVLLNALVFALPYRAGWPDAASALVQVYFAKQFGIAVVTLPLVVGWIERARPAPEGPPRARWVLVLAAMLALSVWLSGLVRAGIGDAPQLVMMDYRLVLIAIIGWCMLNLRMSVAMALLAIALFLMVQGLAGAARQNGTLVGVVNLAHLGIEVAILLVGMLYYTLSMRDRRNLQRRIVEDSHRDSITGLPNYTALREQPEALPGAAGEIGYLLLDQADALAVGYGLQAQAAAMSAVAARLAGAMRPYYLGAGQFALLPDAPRVQASAWEALLASAERVEHRIDGRRVRMTPYLGVAAFGGSGGGDIEHALLNASSLAYEARRCNEVRPLFADVSQSMLRREGQRRLHDAADAVASLRAGRLLLYFQSICPVEGGPASGPIRGEVLCRLLAEDGEVILPGRFVDIMEGSRRGPELDLAVTAALLRELRARPEAIPRCESISINLTGQSLSSDGFRRKLEGLLAQAPLPMSCLCFEITETAAIGSTDHAGALLRALRTRGCRVAIDDFGTGMQSFARLRELPFDVIKIDGSFVRNMLHDARDLEVVQASVAIARASGAEVVAEFVENEEVAQRLREMGVRWVQGFLYSRPLPLRDVLAAAA